MRRRGRRVVLVMNLSGISRRPNPRNRIERARQDGAADIHDAVEVEQYASDDAGVSSDC